MPEASEFKADTVTVLKCRDTGSIILVFSTPDGFTITRMAPEEAIGLAGTLLQCSREDVRVSLN